MYNQYKIKTNRKLCKMNECMDQVPGHFNHQIVVMVLLSRINHGISAGYPCCWLPFLEQHYSLCDFFFSVGQERCMLWWMFCRLHALTFVFAIPSGMLFLQISTSSPPHCFRSLLKYFLLSQVLPAYPTLNFNIQFIPLPCFIFLHSLSAIWHPVASLTCLMSISSHCKLSL